MNNWPSGAHGYEYGQQRAVAPCRNKSRLAAQGRSAAVLTWMICRWLPPWQCPSHLMLYKSRYTDSGDVCCHFSSSVSFFHWGWEEDSDVTCCDVSAIVCVCMCVCVGGGGYGCSSAGRAFGRHAADAGLIPQCGKGFFSQSAFSAGSLMVPIRSCVQSHAFISVRSLRIPKPISEFSGSWKHWNTQHAQ